MSVLELTKDAPTKEESSERTGLFSSLFSGESRCELVVTNERERFDTLAKAADEELGRKGSSVAERHKAAKELTEALVTSKAFNLKLIEAAYGVLHGVEVLEKAEAKTSKPRFRLLHEAINWVLAFSTIPLFVTGFLVTVAGSWVTAGLMCLVILNNSHKFNKVRMLKILTLPIIYSLLVSLVLNRVVSGLPAIILEIVMTVFICYLLPDILLPEDDSELVVKGEHEPCLIDSVASEYALSVVKKCFDAGVISDSSFSAEAEDTASGDEVYERVPERVRVSALLAILRGDKESISLKALLRKTGRGEGA